MIQSLSRVHAPQQTPIATRQDAALVDPSNQAMQDQLAGEVAPGPFDTPLLNAALAAAFDDDLTGLTADWAADDQAEALGANAFTAGQQMAFGSGVGEDPTDADVMAIVGEETAHALAGGGSGQTLLDAPDDPGEARAKDAGQRFAAWMTGGMRGEAPALAPARGGRAQIHRNASTTLTGVPSLKLGSQGSQVTVCQELLNQHGAGIVVDGDFGPQTQGAVIAFQSANGLIVDGVVGPQTAGALNAVSAAPATGGGLTGVPSMQRGSQGGEVPALQQALTDAGYWCVVDGDFGSQTEGQVVAYQASRGLFVDGVVGPQTAGALNEGAPEVAGPVPSSSGSADAADYDPANRLGNASVAPGNRRLAEQTAELLTDAGYQPYIVSVYRTFEEQDATYAQGRTEPGSIVTWVQGGGSWHNYGCAVDFAFWNASHTGPSWESYHPWDLIGTYGLAAGYTRWGGGWGDSPHLELHPSWGNSCSDLASTATSQGLPTVWNLVGAN